MQTKTTIALNIFAAYQVEAREMGWSLAQYIKAVDTLHGTGRTDAEIEHLAATIEGLKRSDAELKSAAAAAEAWGRTLRT